MVDPNCRPVLIEDPDGYRSRLTTLLQRTHVLKASEEDDTCTQETRQ
jgi:hypothetical protein